MAANSTVAVCPSCQTRNRVPAYVAGTPRCASCESGLPWLVNATDADFANVIRTRQLVLVDLWAPWCGPCQLIAPILEKLSAEFAGQLKVVKVNVDENPQTGMNYQAQSIPMMVFIRDGETVETVIGAHPELAIRHKIQQHLAS